MLVLIRTIYRVSYDLPKTIHSPITSSKLRPQGGGERGDIPHTEKIAVEKWLYFPGLYKVTIS